MWKWARDRHPRRNAEWVFEKYVMKEGDRKWIFGKTLSESLFDISTVTNWKLFPLKEGLNPYLSGNQEYFENRRKRKIEAKLRAAIYRKYKQVCPHCDQCLHNGEQIEMHHLIWAKVGGKWKMDNIQPLHRICHQSITHSTLIKKNKEPAEK